MLTPETVRRERRGEILRLVEHHGAYEARVFGFVARDEAHAASDLGLLERCGG
jgi:predicted nucleotidyltransferase